MRDNIRLILDNFCEVYDLLLPWADGEFYDLQNHAIVPGAIYVVSRWQFEKHRDQLVSLAQSNTIKIIMSQPAEGSWTMVGVVGLLRIEHLVKSKMILLITGGDMDDSWTHLPYESFMPKLHDYEENLIACERSSEIYTKHDKPYKFLFLNGRSRPNRKYLIEKFNLTGLLDQALWSLLDTQTALNRQITLMHQGQDLMSCPRPVKYLQPEYEYDNYQHRVDTPTTDTFVKNHLFDREWGEIYIKAEAYIDTYFSLVTETVFEYPYSFRTEKIWKPIVMGHPWIAAANQGYYRDMRNLGYKTFGHVIDESFDSIENNQDRIQRIATVVEDLCQQDLASFLDSCYNVCKYNQERYVEARSEVRARFPDRFFNFINQHWPQ
jgi:hypothetical protein